MKKKMKKFDLYTSKGVVKVAGRDIHDGYRRACNKYEWVGQPRKSSNHRSWAKTDCNRRFRRRNTNNPREIKLCAGDWVATYKGIVVWY
jgi:hypothetical protein